MLTVTAPASSNDLTTLANVKAELSITGTASDTDLSAAIKRASLVLARFCRRTGWGRETVVQTERLARERGGLVLRRDILPAITSVTLDGVALTAGADYELDGSLLWRLSAVGSTTLRMNWCRGVVVVTYAAGFASVTDVPADLEQACLVLVTGMWRARGRDPLLRSEAAEGVGSASYMDARAGDLGLPDDVASLAGAYIAPGDLL